MTLSPNARGSIICRRHCRRCCSAAAAAHVSPSSWPLNRKPSISGQRRGKSSGPAQAWLGRRRPRRYVQAGSGCGQRKRAELCKGANAVTAQFTQPAHTPAPLQLEEGEKRLELALHYGIAWPRLFHADQFARVCGWLSTGRESSPVPRLTPSPTATQTLRLPPQVPYVQAPQQAEPEAVASGIRDQGTAAKLAAAARRRKERLARQQQQQPEGRAA